ncbi:PTS lactose/cellobiose transporter subunit IIA [Psychrilyobacter atlanticus]|uniref:PTS lactose/cellobiose transporter subunit IIA n=1 Tax=Psychrilyobacter atlanticus TaxID=271091 RepID=UPI0003FB222C|nr:PTS lactose/cellobiose transporter subunit IIA [Psychrilyobacter atlanticus]
MDMEMAAMGLVGNSGEARSLAFEAIKKAKDGKYDEAREMLEKAKKKSLLAHETQTELICAEADGKKMEMGLLMVHAQDHLMTSILARDLAAEIIDLHEKLNNK